MTIELLEEYRGLVANAKAINMEIDTLYTPVSSPNGKQSLGSSGSGPSDPTRQAVNRIMTLQEKLANEEKRINSTLNEIENWLLTCPDYEIAAIIRYHYLLGQTWKQTTMKVYGYPDYHYCRKKVMRYFRKEK